MKTMRYLLALLIVAGWTSCAFGAGVVVGAIGGGGVSEPVPVGSDQTFFAEVYNGASSVQFYVLDSHENVVFTSAVMSVGADSSVLMTWSPPFADTFTVWAVTYDPSGLEMDRQQVLLVSAYQPDATGFITGGGWMEISGYRRTFGFVAQVQRNGAIKGSLEYQQHALGVNLKSYVVDWVCATSASEGYFSGWATINGAGFYRFYAAVLDSGEPGGGDFFALWVYTPDGSMAFADWGYLEGGNLVIHSNR